MRSGQKPSRPGLGPSPCGGDVVSPLWCGMGAWQIRIIDFPFVLNVFWNYHLCFRKVSCRCSKASYLRIMDFPYVSDLFWNHHFCFRNVSCRRPKASYLRITGFLKVLHRFWNHYFFLNASLAGTPKLPMSESLIFPTFYISFERKLLELLTQAACLPAYQPTSQPANQPTSPFSKVAHPANPANQPTQRTCPFSTHRMSDHGGTGFLLRLQKVCTFSEGL